MALFTEPISEKRLTVGTLSDNLHRKLDVWRQQEKMTLEELGKMAKIKRYNLSKYINGRRRPTPETAKRLEMVTGIPLEDWLLGDPEYLRRQFKIFQKTK